VCSSDLSSTYESDSTLFSDEPLTTHRWMELIDSQTEDFKEKLKTSRTFVSRALGSLASA
jgi:hypothetical protein